MQRFSQYAIIKVEWLWGLTLYWTSRMSRCSEQKQRMKWEPLPLPMVDASLFQHHGERARLLNKQMNDASFLPDAVNASTVRKTTPPSSSMPPHWCFGWGKHNSSYPIQPGLIMTNYKASRLLLTFLRIPEGSPKTGDQARLPPPVTRLQQ